jgi:shikimate dehydrogenase
MSTQVNSQANSQASDKSFLVGLIGSGIGGSLSPAMHEEEGSKLGLRYVYRRIDLEALQLDIAALPDLLTAAQRMGYNGLNITYPCKQAVIPLLDELSDDARALGAVNTVLFKDGKRIGHNTDWSGFARAFQRGLPDVSLARVVQLGAGGAGAAVAHAALTMGAQTLTLFDVDAARAASLAEDLQKRFPASTVSAGNSLTESLHGSLHESLHESLAAANGLIHATPTGMAKLPGLPLPVELLHRDLWVADIVYFPIRTALLQAAETLGCRTLSGGGMAVYQAVDAMRIFTGLEPDAERVYTHFQSLLQRQASSSST